MPFVGVVLVLFVITSNSSKSEIGEVIAPIGDGRSCTNRKNISLKAKMNRVKNLLRPYYFVVTDHPMGQLLEKHQCLNLGFAMDQLKVVVVSY